MYQLAVLSASDAPNYHLLTYPLYQPLLQNLTDAGDVIAIGIEQDSTPVALILSRSVSGSNAIEICSLFVVPEHRRQGLGKQLIRASERSWTERGGETLFLCYLASPTTPALEHILAECGWSDPEPQTYIVYGDRAAMERFATDYNREYLPRLQYLQKQCELFPWTSLTPQEREFLKQYEQDFSSRSDRFYSSPFITEACYRGEIGGRFPVEPRSSLGLRCGDRVIGWMINIRNSPDTVAFTSLFVDPDHQPVNRCLWLFIHSLNLQLEDPAFQTITFRGSVKNSRMIRFSERFLFPYANSIRYSYQSTKSLKSAIPTAS